MNGLFTIEKLVPEVGLEPTRRVDPRGILSPVRLPIPPLRHQIVVLLPVFCREHQRAARAISYVDLHPRSREAPQESIRPALLPPRAPVWCSLLRPITLLSPETRGGMRTVGAAGQRNFSLTCSTMLRHGLAEMNIGTGKGQAGMVIVVTFGTGIGTQSSLTVASCRAPNLAILRFVGKGVGGGASKKYRKFIPLPRTLAPVVPAPLLNEGGVVSAALAAQEHSEASDKS
jgi:hypothetical protein